MSHRFVVVSGCSGAGKSTLVAELGRRAYRVVDEPGRRIVRQELAAGGTALPWSDPAGFARRAVSLAIADWEAARGNPGWTVFDRGLVDAAAALEQASGEPALQPLARAHPYGRTVFLAPPWPEIYVQDEERRHDFAAAAAEYERLLQAYGALGYRIVLLPKAPAGTRADFVMAELGAAG